MGGACSLLCVCVCVCSNGFVQLNVKNVVIAIPTTTTTTTSITATVIVPSAPQRISVICFTEDLSRKADGLISENLTASAVARSGTASRRRRRHRRKIGMHLNVRQVILKERNNTFRPKLRNDNLFLLRFQLITPPK